MVNLMFIAHCYFLLLSCSLSSLSPSPYRSAALRMHAPTLIFIDDSINQNECNLFNKICPVASPK